MAGRRSGRTKPHPNTTKRLSVEENARQVALLIGKKPVWRDVPVCCDPEAADDLRTAREELAAAQRAALGIATAIATGERVGDERYDVTTEPAVVAARERVEAAEERVRETTVVLRFVAMPREDYFALLDVHQPTDEDRKNGYDGYAPSFRAALIAATCVSPRLEVADVEGFEKTWNEGEWLAIWTAAYTVNNARIEVDLGKG